MKVVGCNRLHGRQVPWSTIKRKGKKWSILYRLHSGRSPRFDWTGLAADYTSRILRLVPASGAFRIPNALGRPGGIARIVQMGNAQQKSLALPPSCAPQGFAARNPRPSCPGMDGCIPVRPIIDLYQCLEMLQQSFM
jgi:hypothetical protein